MQKETEYLDKCGETKPVRWHAVSLCNANKVGDNYHRIKNIVNVMYETTLCIYYILNKIET